MILFRTTFVHGSVVLTGLLLAVAGCGDSPRLSHGPMIPAASADSIVLGCVSQEPVAKIRRWSPLVEHVAAQLDEVGIGHGEVKVTERMEQMADWLLAGDVDLFIDSFYPATVVGRRAGIEPSLLGTMREGSKWSVFFAHQDSGLASLTSLKGQIIALEGPASTSGFMVPLAYLIRAGFKPVEKITPLAAVAAEEVGYVYSGDDHTTVQWVLNRRLIAGATDNLSFYKLADEVARQLIVLAETEPVINDQLVLLGESMPRELKAALTDALLGLDRAVEGRAILKTAKLAGLAPFSEDQGTGLAQAQVLYDQLTRWLESER